MQQICIRAKGVSPLLMHSDRFANPLDPMTKAHKELTGKRKKTDDDHEAIAKSEWFGSLYLDPDIGPFIPGQNVESCIVAGAKLQKLGTACKRGLSVLEDKIKVEYTGTRDPEKLYDKKEFVDIRSVKVGTAKIMRCRPKFNQWSVQFTVLLNETILDAQEVVKAIEDAGLMCGLGDYRPRFGKFDVEVLS